MLTGQCSDQIIWAGLYICVFNIVTGDFRLLNPDGRAPGIVLDPLSSDLTNKKFAFAPSGKVDQFRGCVVANALSNS